LILSRRKVPNGLFETAFDIQSTDATTNWNVEEGLSSKDEALYILFESAAGCIFAEAFNAVFAELIYFVEVMGSNANNAKAWRETVGVEDTWTFTARDWTIFDNPELWLELIVEKRTRADESLRGLAERKCVIWGLVRRSSRSMSVVSEYTKQEWRNPLEARLIGVGWELLEAAIG